MGGQGGGMPSGVPMEGDGFGPGPGGPMDGESQDFNRGGYGMGAEQGKQVCWRRDGASRKALDQHKCVSR